MTNVRAKLAILTTRFSTRRENKGGIGIALGSTVLVEKKVWSEAAFGCVTQLW